MAQYRQQYGGGFSDSRGGHHHQGLPDWHRPHHASSKTASRIRRLGKPAQRRRSPAAAAAVAAALLLLAAVFLLSRRISHGPAEISQGASAGESLPEWNQSNIWKELKFGHSGGGRSARDSRYWDRDDRRRDEDYTEARPPSSHVRE